ncbi:MAG: choice-of-anchor D domain-containing protein [Myxococcales bacterium]
MPFVREFAVLVAAVALGACTCDGRLVPIAGDLAARLEGGTFSYDLAVDLGTVLPGQLVDRKLYLKNQGGYPLAVASLSVEGNSTVLGSPYNGHPFAIDLQHGVTLEPGVERLTRVLFYAAPELATSSIEYSSNIRLVASGARSGDVSVRLRLVARVTPCPDLQPAQVDFGPTLVGRQSTRILSVANPTSYEFTVTAPFGALDGSRFRYLTAFPLLLPPGGFAEVSVAFEPDRSSSFQAEATLFAGSCTATSSHLAGLGLAHAIDWSPDAIDCGWVPLGLTASRSVTLTNRSATTVRLTDAQIVPDADGTIAGDFQLPEAEWPSSFALAPGQSTTKSVVCSPTGLDQKKARLEIGLDMPGQAQASIELSEAGGGPELALAPAAIDFGQVAYVADAALYEERPVGIGNAGNAPSGQELAAALRLGTPRAYDSDIVGPPYYRVEVENANTAPEEFSLELPPDFDGSGRIVSGAWINATVRFTPLTTGPKRATVVLVTNDLHEPMARLAVSAEAVGMPPCSLRVLTPSLDFGIVHATSPRTFEVILENQGTAANQRCLLSDWRLDGSADGFSADMPLQATILDPGERLRVPVRLAPQAPPSHDPVLLAGLLRAKISSPATPFLAVNLSGYRGQACLTFLPDQPDFGTIPPGTASAEVSPQLLDLCGENVTLSQVALEAPEGGFEMQLSAPIPATGQEVISDDIRRPALAETHPFTVRFLSQTPGQFQARVIVDILRSGKQLRYVLPLAGTADATAPTEVAYQQGGKDAVDILLRVEPWNLNYTGRAEEKAVFRAEQFAAQASTLLRVLERAGSDYHLGVIEPTQDGYYCWPSDCWADAGILYSDSLTPEPFLTPSTQDAAAKLARKISPHSPLDPYVSHDWGGFGDWFDLVLWRALTPPFSNVQNLGFRRSAARLSLLAVDNGHNWFSRHPGAEFQYYAPHPHNPGELAKSFMELAGPPYLGRLSFAHISFMSNLASPYPFCVENESGLRLDFYSSQAYAQLFGGSLGDLCRGNDTGLWQEFAEQLGETASGMRLRFPLRTRPDLSRGDIAVTVDGTVVLPIDSSGAEVWHYDPVANAVRFGVETTPLPGSRISIRYYTLVP